VRKYKALLLDFYGTLVHEDHEVLIPTCKRIAETAKVPVDPQWLSRHWPYVELCNRYNGENFKLQRDIELEAAKVVVERYGCPIDPAEIGAAMTRYVARPTVYEDADWFVANAPLPICIVSNIDNRELASAIARAGWRFAHVVTSEDARVYKPRREIFELALDAVGARPQEVLHAGDSPASDVFGAGRLGIDTVWVNRLRRVFPAELERPTFEVADLKGLHELLTG